MKKHKGPMNLVLGEEVKLDEVVNMLGMVLVGRL